MFSPSLFTYLLFPSCFMDFASHGFTHFLFQLLIWFFFPFYCNKYFLSSFFFSSFFSSFSNLLFVGHWLKFIFVILLKFIFPPSSSYEHLNLLFFNFLLLFIPSLLIGEFTSSNLLQIILLYIPLLLIRFFLSLKFLFSYDFSPC